MLAGLHSQGHRHRRRAVGAVEHDAVDIAHHVERSAVDGLVDAHAQRRRHGHVGAADGGDDAVLTRHVVGGGQHMPQRRAAQHETSAIGADDLEREVRATTGDQLERERRHRTRDVGCQPLADRFDVDALHERKP